MFRLNQLIADLCPNGVKHLLLEEVAHYGRERIPATEVDCETYVGVENLLQNKQGKTSATNVPADGQVIRFDKGDILIGNIRPYLKKIWLSDVIGGTNGDVLVIQINDKNVLLPKFLYYVLSSDKFFLYDTQNSKGAKMPRGDKSAVMKYSIPVPPMAIQDEIVQILDNFTELTAELTARKIQYECYRNHLLTRTSYEGTLIAALGETCDMKAGKAIPAIEISDKQTEDTPYPCYGGNGLRGYTANYNQDGSYPLIGRQGALCGNVCFATGKFYATEHAVVVSQRGKYDQRFLYHLLVNGNLNQYKTAGAQPGLSVARLEKVEFPVPPISVQQRIATVLDNFDAICSDLNIGLPAEINARQKQYEYYRDMLLTFAETGPTILDRQTDRQTSIVR